MLGSNPRAFDFHWKFLQRAYYSHACSMFMCIANIDIVRHHTTPQEALRDSSLGLAHAAAIRTLLTRVGYCAVWNRLNYFRCIFIVTGSPRAHFVQHRRYFLNTVGPAFLLLPPIGDFWICMRRRRPLTCVFDWKLFCWQDEWNVTSDLVALTHKT